MYPPPSFSFSKCKKMPYESEEIIEEKINEVNKKLAVMKGVKFGGVGFIVFKS